MAGGRIWAIEEMEEIERLLNEGLTITEISKKAKVDRTEIAIASMARKIQTSQSPTPNEIVRQIKAKQKRLKDSLSLGQKIIGVKYLGPKHNVRLKGTIIGIYRHHVRLKLDKHKYTECFRYQDIRGIS